MVAGGWVEGEEEASRLARVFQQIAAQPKAPVVEPGAETAQVTYDRMIEELAPQLRSLGFKGSKKLFQVNRGDRRGEIAIRKGRTGGTRGRAPFSVTLCAVHVPTKTIYWEEALSRLCPPGDLQHYSIDAGVDATAVSTRMISQLRSYGLVALDVALDEAEYPPDAGRVWSRTFPLPTARGVPRDRRSGSANPREALRERLERKLTIDRMLAELEDADGGIRWAALRTLMGRPEEPRVLSGLLRILEEDPLPSHRIAVARWLGWNSLEPARIQGALEEAASEDAELNVRLSARFALALMSPPGD